MPLDDVWFKQAQRAMQARRTNSRRRSAKSLLPRVEYPLDQPFGVPVHFKFGSKIVNDKLLVRYQEEKAADIILATTIRAGSRSLGEDKVSYGIFLPSCDALM